VPESLTHDTTLSAPGFDWEVKLMPGVINVHEHPQSPHGERVVDTPVAEHEQFAGPHVCTIAVQLHPQSPESARVVDTPEDEHEQFANAQLALELLYSVIHDAL
jgi:hypothetical protein